MTELTASLLTTRASRTPDASDEAAGVSGRDEIAGVQTRLAVDAVLQQLAPDFRIALVLRELEGLEYAEIAEVLQIPLGTVRSRLFAARERFRMLWAEGEK